MHIIGGLITVTEKNVITKYASECANLWFQNNVKNNIIKSATLNQENILMAFELKRQFLCLIDPCHLMLH